ncbi:hypothetical protein R5W24_003891 [Gemmata sp. JC717]|uniref:Uncharacterized protein n=1 Tax=Gemmata algarum TaxID=2975278 RepID=A0ABU5ESU4_9BACT|nr:hypothetical protein [Gemmata algarum]MDY3554762.1 hypothetical protein [Gemmata algarum]MDY3558408.1 hypothetical protein [Gemmata algarum]
MAHTIYRRPAAGGATLRQIVGLPFPAEAGGAFTVPAAALALEYAKPEPGDRVRDDDGDWWVVSAVSGPTEGEYTLTCEAAP